MARVFFQLPVRLGPRLGVDAVMTLLFVTSLAFRSTGTAPHEWIGVGFAVLFGLHTAVNLGWYRTLFTGRYGVRRACNTLTNMALLVSMLVLCVTGILNSRHIFGLSQYFDGAGPRELHSFAAYWSLVFIGIHAGLHWDMIRGAFRKAFGKPENLSYLWAARSAAFLAVIGGVWASFDRLMGSKLFLGFSFDFWDPSRPLALFYVANLAIIGMYAIAAHYAQKGFQNIAGGLFMPSRPKEAPVRLTVTTNERSNA